MKIKWHIFIISGVVLAILIRLSYSEENDLKPHISEKVKGVNFVAPRNRIDESSMLSIKSIYAEWIAIIPYAYTPKNSSKVLFYKNHPHWWGEGVEGVISQILMAKNKNLKIMVKPHVWVLENGWAGEFQCESENKWQEWEKSYSNYVLTYARLCDSLEVDLFCFSTEYCQAIKLRPRFWEQLIDDIKDVYDGPLTYAANWDNYENVLFWDQLDFIGVDAYFPLSDEKSPSISSIKTNWDAYAVELNRFSKAKKKSILFTEYGYRSCDHNTRSPWESMNGSPVNISAQKVAFKAFFESVWDQDWFMGGFVWKWHSDHENAGGSNDSEFTPQNKPAEKVIKAVYSEL